MQEEVQKELIQRFTDCTDSAEKELLRNTLLSMRATWEHMAESRQHPGAEQQPVDVDVSRTDVSILKIHPMHSWHQTKTHQLTPTPQKKSEERSTPSATKLSAVHHAIGLPRSGPPSWTPPPSRGSTMLQMNHVLFFVAKQLCVEEKGGYLVRSELL